MNAAEQPAGPGRAAGAADDVAAQIRQLRDELGAIKQTIADFGQASSGRAGGGCNCAACADAASQLARHAKQNARAAIADLEAYAKQNLRCVVGGALGAGLVLGLLLRRH